MGWARVAIVLLALQLMGCAVAQVRISEDLCEVRSFTLARSLEVSSDCESQVEQKHQPISGGFAWLLHGAIGYLAGLAGIP